MGALNAYFAVNYRAMDKTQIIAALGLLAEIARREGRVIDIAIYGGAAIILAWGFRVSTMDVDAVCMDTKANPFLRKAVAEVAEAQGLEADWLNDAVKGFIHGKQDLRELPLFCKAENPGLRVFVPSAEYMLAMKSMAMRLEPHSTDADDIESLLDTLGIDHVDAALDIVSKYYPDNLIAPKVRFGLEEIIARRHEKKAAQPE